MLALPTCWLPLLLCEPHWQYVPQGWVLLQVKFDVVASTVKLRGISYLEHTLSGPAAGEAHMQQQKKGEPNR